MVQWLRLHLPMQGVQIQSLIRELRSYMPQGRKKQNMKQKQYCTKFSKGFEKSPHLKKIFKKERKKEVRRVGSQSGSEIQEKENKIKSKMLEPPFLLIVQGLTWMPGSLLY